MTFELTQLWAEFYHLRINSLARTLTAPIIHSSIPPSEAVRSYNVLEGQKRVHGETRTTGDVSRFGGVRLVFWTLTVLMSGL